MPSTTKANNAFNSLYTNTIASQICNDANFHEIRLKITARCQTKEKAQAINRDKVVSTTNIVKEFYNDICLGSVERYCVGSLSSINFVLNNALNGSVTKSLCIDKHGKSLGMALLDIELDQG